MASKGGKEEIEENELILSLPKERGLALAPYLFLFQDSWCTPRGIEGRRKFHKHFQAKENDVYVASFPKSGTTWLKALVFAIVNHQTFPSFENHHPLLTSNPHELVPFLDFIFLNDTYDQSLLSNMGQSRLFHTHSPFPSLPNSIRESKGKLIYICRNPFDTFVSAWEFYCKLKFESLPKLTFEEAFEKYCSGIMEFGPWWSHMLGYWKESITRPNKVLFLKYEDLKKDIEFHVKGIVEFLGCSLTQEEGESTKVIESIIKLCNFENLKDLEVNTSGYTGSIFIEKRSFFRKGEVGDWTNYFSPSMTEKLSKIMEEKLSGSGLSFNMYS